VQQVVLLEAVDPTLAAVRQRFVADHRGVSSDTLNPKP
jgi:hypothetical protein